jgi:hypothetical protein
MAVPEAYKANQAFRLRRPSPEHTEKLTEYSREQLKRRLFETEHDPRVLLRILAKEKSNYAKFVKEVVYFAFKEGPDADIFFQQNTRTYERAYRQMFVDFVSHKAGKKYLEGILGIEITDEQYERIAHIIKFKAYPV